MQRHSTKTRLAWGGIAQAGQPFGYGIIGHELHKALVGAGAEMLPLHDNSWDLAIGVGLPAMWAIGKQERPDMIWHTMLEVTPIIPNWEIPINNTAGLWVPSVWVKELFEEGGVRKPIMVSGYGVDTDTFSFVDRSNRTGPFKVVTWGRSFSSRKNLFQAIRAFVAAELPDAIMEVKVNSDDILAPTGVKDHPEIRIIREDWPRQELVNWLQGADAFIYLSAGEGYGLMPLEAMATGLPTICAYNTGMKDFLEPSYAYLVESEGLEIARTYTRSFGYDCYWHKVSLDSAVEQLRQVYYNNTEAINKGKIASEVVQQMTWGKAGENALKLIQSTFLGGK